MAKSKKKSRARRFGGRLKRHVKAAKPSLAIVGGLAIPAVQVITGASSQFSGGSSSVSFNPRELANRFRVIYLGSVAPNPVTIQSAATSNAAKAGVIGFVVHWLANISGANRYLARMKAPVRI